MIIPNLSYTYNSGTVNDLINDLVALGTANVTMVDLPFSSDEITAYKNYISLTRSYFIAYICKTLKKPHPS